MAGLRITGCDVSFQSCRDLHASVGALIQHVWFTAWGLRTKSTQTGLTGLMVSQWSQSWEWGRTHFYWQSWCEMFRCEFHNKTFKGLIKSKVIIFLTILSRDTKTNNCICTDRLMSISLHPGLVCFSAEVQHIGRFTVTLVSSLAYVIRNE